VSTMNKPKQETNKVAGSAKDTGKKMLGGLFMLLSGRWMSRDYIFKNLSFILYLVMLLLMYIAYGYEAERTVRKLYKVDAELKELKSEYTTTFSKLEVVKQQSTVAENIKELGLKESLVPPKKIALTEKEKKEYEN
jgi:hypothetical protein